MMEGDFIDNNFQLFRIVFFAAFALPGIILFWRVSSHRNNMQLLKNKGEKISATVTNFVAMRGAYGREVANVVYYEYFIEGIKYIGKANWGIAKYKMKFEGKERLNVDDDIEVVYLPENYKVSFPVEQLKHENGSFTFGDIILILIGFSPIIMLLYTMYFY